MHAGGIFCYEINECNSVYMSFPLVGNLSEGESRKRSGWTSQNDRYRISNELLERVS
jgi:hypothetical protein